MPSKLRQAQLADVIATVVANCPDLNSPRDVCSLLLVDSSCRQKLQEREVMGHLHVKDWATLCRPADAVERSLMATNFFSWLLQHAGLVSCLSLTQEHRSFYGNWRPPSDSEWLLLQQLLALDLQHCRMSAVANSITAQPLHLRECYIHGSVQVPLLLQELAAAGLQSLYLLGQPPIADNCASSCASALAKMTSLKTLRGRGMDACCLEAADQVLPQLTQLTFLNMALPASVAAQLPVSLQRLVLTSCTKRQVANQSPQCELDLSHLSALQFLVWTSCHTASLKLPPNLTFLHLSSNCVVQHITGGAGRGMEVWVDIDDTAGLASLIAASRLPGIDCLHVLSEGIDDTDGSAVEAAQQAAAAVSMASSTTLLYFLNSPPCCDVVSWCQPLARLPQLQHLVLDCTALRRDELLQLSSLTRLTQLKVEDNNADDVVAVSLALHLTRLRVLKLTSDGLSSAAVLPAAASALTGLVGLQLVGGPSFRPGDSDLMLLSRLTQLTQLVLWDHSCSTEGQQRFLAGMPHLVEVADHWR